MLILVMDELVLPPGAVIPKSTQLVDAFFAEEWAYYDGIEGRDPNRIRPVDATGLPVLELRILEVLVWMWADPLRQYLTLLDSTTPDEPHSRDR